jgi:hypothetical protein
VAKPSTSLSCVGVFRSNVNEGGVFMSTNRFLRSALIALACVAVMPAAASAQSSIAGQVNDNTGGVLPGVTV